MLALAALALSLPLHFEPIGAEAGVSDQYWLSTPAYGLLLSDTGVYMHLPNRQVVRMNLPRVKPEPEDLLPGVSNYYTDPDHAAWRLHVPNYARVRYHSVFPGVDLLLYGDGRGVSYDWLIAPGADPSRIRFSFTGARGIRIDDEGNLIVRTPVGDVRHNRPFIYQISAGQRRSVPGGFRLTANGEVRFWVGPYDHRRALTIDPAMVYATGFGGGGSDFGTNIGLDSSGNIYISGTAFSLDFPLLGSLTAGSPGEPAAWVFAAKIASDGRTLLYSTLLAGGTLTPNNSDVLSLITGVNPLASSMAVDRAGNAYLTGATTGQGFPVLSGGPARTAGGNDAFIVKLDPGGALLASVLLGGSKDDAGMSIALGPDGALYVAGITGSSDFPTTPGAYHRTAFSQQDVFLVKMNPAGLTASQSALAALTYSTYLGPGTAVGAVQGIISTLIAAEYGPMVAVDSAGNAYIAASTNSSAWATTSGAVQPHCASSPCSSAVLAEVDPSGSSLLYATYFGGSGRETASGIALDSSGNIYLAGTTQSSDLPTTPGAFQGKRLASGETSYAAKFSPGGKLVYSTYLGGTGGAKGNGDKAHGIAVDSDGDLYVAGETGSADFPIKNAVQPTLDYYVCSRSYTTPGGNFPLGIFYCGSAGTLAVLNSSGTGLLWSTFVGAGAVYAVALDRGGNLYATGNDLTILPGAGLDSSPGNSVCVLKIAPQGAPLQLVGSGSTDGASFNPGLPSSGGLASLFVSGLSLPANVVASGEPLPTELAGVTILVNGIPAPILGVFNLPPSGGVASQQINFQVPFETAAQFKNQYPPYTVEARYGGISTFATAKPVAPGIFLLADGTPAIQHASDYSLVTPAHPAAPGEAIIVYATGLGKVTSGPATGMPAAGPASLNGTCFPFAVEIGGGSTPTVLYAGLTPGYVGLYQVNLVVPPDLPSGSANLALECAQNFPGLQDGPSPWSNPVKLAVQ